MQGNAAAHRHAAQAPSQIRVVAPARLHFGFVDLHGGLGRRFGSLGLAIDRPSVRLRARRSAKSEFVGAGSERAARVVELIAQRFALDTPVRIDVEETIPSHIGLGSGTQLTLATAAALCALTQQRVPIAELVRVLQRGTRSGIGSGVFESGGFVVDGGRGALDAAPPVLSRLPFPDDWRVVLLFDHQSMGLHGEREVAAFCDLPPFPERQAERLARLVLMQLLPALAESQLEPFGAALSDLQRTIGDYFAPAQGGRYASHRVAQAVEALAALGAAGYGQSSWGPTGFAIFANQIAAERALEQLHIGSGPTGAVSAQVVRGCNRGAQIEPFALSDRAVAA